MNILLKISLLLLLLKWKIVVIGHFSILFAMITCFLIQCMIILVWLKVIKHDLPQIIYTLSELGLPDWKCLTAIEKRRL